MLHRLGTVQQALDALSQLDTTGFYTTVWRKRFQSCEYIRPSGFIQIDNGDDDEKDDHPSQPDMKAVCAISKTAHDDIPIQTDVFLHSQAADMYFRSFSKTGGMPDLNVM